MRRKHLTKIVATLGPATSDAKMIEALFHAGVDMFRLNFSHGAHADHRRNIEAIRHIERRVKRPIAILMDVQGPKLRIGSFANGPVNLPAGATFRLELEETPGDATHVTMPHPEIFAVLEPGAELLVDDGRVRLRVLESNRKAATTEVVIGGAVSDRKGVNVPGLILPISALTEKDRTDLQFGLDNGVDYCGMSFVQRPDDLAEARRIIQGRAALMAKLEKPAAIQRLQEIVELSDAVMVARGDLGVELPPEDVPVVQKRILDTCRQAGKPCVVATQMLDSMVDRPVPTRAEASDVANAVYDGADAVMLSAETAVGKYPVESVEMMNRIIERVESDPRHRTIIDAGHPEPEPTAADAISAAARQVARTLSAAAIVTYTTSGSTTVRASRERPEVPILGLTPSLPTARRLAVVWGVHSINTHDARSFADMITTASGHAVADGFAKSGDRIVVTAGVPFGTPGATNVLRIARVQ
ncbi:MAG: pyruvate kinase [Alphaproteobacteria bacterium]